MQPLDIVMTNELFETGYVVQLDGSSAIIETQSQMGCQSCKANSQCGNGIVEKYFAGKVFHTPVINTLNAKLGDKVILAISKDTVVKASFAVYMFPLFGLFIFVIITSLLDFAEGLQVALGIVGLLIGLFVTRSYNRRLQGNELFEVRLVSVDKLLEVDTNQLKEPFNYSTKARSSSTASISVKNL